MPAWAVGFASRIGLTGLAIAVLLALLAVQTARLEGFKVWPISVEGWKPKAQRLAGELEAITKAQKQAAKAQQRVNAAREQAYRDIAKGSEDEKKLVDIAVRDAVADYARTHRVQPATCRASSGPGPSPASGAAGVAETVPEPAGVVISEPELRQLSDAAGYAVSCHNWAVGIATAGK